MASTSSSCSAGVRRVMADQQIADNVARLRTELDSYEPLTIVRRRLEEDASLVE